MPVQSGQPDDVLRKILDQIEPGEPVIVPPIKVIKEPPAGFMSWEERLRTTEDTLQKLSTGYPFTWHSSD